MITPRELTAADWHRLNGLLATALELDGEARTVWLGTLPPDALDLKPLLAQLLADGRDLDGTSETLRPVVALAAEAMAGMRREAAGDRIGPWRLVRLLAEGGMGAVWEAARADGVMQRRAALKLPRAEWVDRGLTERITRERAILARLQHPAIAVLYDAGLAEGGRPYLALEYVDGVPIDAYCAGRDLKDVLQLMVQVIRAVAYAHGQLVIHRDLKPANVLVTADGAPKLLDFGISKLLEGETSTAEATALTRMAGRPMTLAYAAPEQVLALAVTVAADVYALGVMLFELTTGQRLYQANEPRALEAELLRGDLRRPSDAAGEAARARALKGDLDAIIGTALKRQPTERYDSAAALADDLERYLEGQPVRARPDSTGYRLKKFVARNTLPVVAAGAALVALGIGLGIALWQGNEARLQAQRATALNTFVLSLIRTADPNASRETKAADVAMLRSIEERIDHDFKGSPDQLLQLRVTVGEAYKNRGEMAAAQRVFQKAVDDAAAHLPPTDLTFLTAQVRASDPSLIVSSETGLQLGRAIEILRGLAPDSRDAADLLLDALLNRIELAQDFGVPDYLNQDETTRSVAEVEAFALQYFGPGTRQHLRAARMVAALAGLRQSEVEMGKVIDDVLAQARARGGAVLESPEYLDLSIIESGLLCPGGKVPEGLNRLWSLARQAREAHGQHSIQLERLYDWIAMCMSAAGDPTSHGWVYDAYEIAAAREQPPSTHLMSSAINAFDRALGARDFDTAERYYQIAMANAAAIPEQSIRDRRTQGLRNGRVVQLMQRGEAAAAVEAAQPMLEYYNQVYARHGRLTPAQGTIWIATADALRQLQRYDEAIAVADTFAQRCRELVRIAPGANCETRALALRALIQLDAGRKDAAVDTLQTLRERYPNAGRAGGDNRDGRLRQANVRLLIAFGGRAEAAEAVELMRQDYGNWLSVQPTSVYAAESLYWFGRAYQAAGDRRGDWMARQAREHLAKSPVATHRRLATHPPPY
jgi:tetratricopeptide (TPR) repeat protein/tRNA A-37 threonylcarbamoyl transferase component Bud32